MSAQAAAAAVVSATAAPPTIYPSHKYAHIPPFDFKDSEALKAAPSISEEMHQKNLKEMICANHSDSDPCWINLVTDMDAQIVDAYRRELWRKGIQILVRDYNFWPPSIRYVEIMRGLALLRPWVTPSEYVAAGKLIETLHHVCKLKAVCNLKADEDSKPEEEDTEDAEGDEKQEMSKNGLRVYVLNMPDIKPAATGGGGGEPSNRCRRRSKSPVKSQNPKLRRGSRSRTPKAKPKS